jgi:uncharacterized protein YndB with AHSA1/START domain
MTEIEINDTNLTKCRTFDAPRERGYRAFVDPEELEQWFVPGEMTAQVNDLELEPDGTLSLRIVDGKRSTTVEGTYLEGLEDERIVHTWQNSGKKESRVTYEFRDVDGGAEVVLVHERISVYRDRSARENVDGCVEGWSNALETLGTVVGRE